MSYVMVTADFPHVTAAQRDAIYKGLMDKKWIKVTEPGRDIDTVWEGYVNTDKPGSDAIRIGVKDFVECSKVYCDCKLVLHWGPNKPVRHGLK